jgi:hypothetical protein
MRHASDAIDKRIAAAMATGIANRGDNVEQPKAL